MPPSADTAVRYLSMFWRLAFWSGLLVVSVLSLLPVEQLPGPEFWDKASHLIAYFGLAALLQLAYPNVAWPTQFAVLFLYSLGIELAQGATGYRFASVADLVANGLGILLFGGVRHVMSTLGAGSR